MDILVSFSKPANPIYGDMYFNNTCQKMFIYHGFWLEFSVLQKSHKNSNDEKKNGRIRKLNKIFKYG